MVLFPGLPLGSQPRWEGPPYPPGGSGVGEGKLSPRLLPGGRVARGRKRSGLVGPVGKSRAVKLGQGGGSLSPRVGRRGSESRPTLSLGC